MGVFLVLRDCLVECAHSCACGHGYATGRLQGGFFGARHTLLECIGSGFLVVFKKQRS